MEFLTIRRKGFEAQFVNRITQTYRARARALHQTGLWAAVQLGLPKAGAEDYAGHITRSLARPGGEKRALGKIRDDLGGMVKTFEVSAKMEEFARQA